MTIDTLIASPPQSAGSPGGLPGGASTSGGPATTGDQFAALIARLGGADGAPPPPAAEQEPAPRSEGGVAIPQAPADIAEIILGLVGQNRGSAQTRSRPATGTASREARAEPVVEEDTTTDATPGVVVPVFVWTLAEPAPEVEVGVAPLAPDLARSDTENAALLVAPAATRAGAERFSPSGPDSANIVAANPAVQARTVPVPAADSVQDVAPAPTPAVQVNQAAVASNEPVSKADVHEAPPAAGNSIRSRDLPAPTPTPTSASSQPAANAAREADDAVVPPVAAAREGSAGASADTSQDHAGRGHTPPPPPIAVIDAATAADSIRNDHGRHAPVSEPVAAVTVVAAPQPGAGSAVPVQHLTGIHAAAVPDDGDVRRQIVQAVRMQWTDGVGDARLTLQPEYLGEVTISLRVEQGGVTARLNADTAEVRAWMSANEPLLRQGLSEHGLTLVRLIVSDKPAESRPEDDGRRHPPQQPREDDTQQPRRQRDTGTFEITV